MVTDDSVPTERKNYYLKQIIEDIVYSRQQWKFIGHGKWNTPPFELDMKMNL